MKVFGYVLSGGLALIGLLFVAAGGSAGVPSSTPSVAAPASAPAPEAVPPAPPKEPRALAAYLVGARTSVGVKVISYTGAKIVIEAGPDTDAFDERHLIQKAYTLLADTSDELFQKLEGLRSYTLNYTTEFTSEDLYGNQKKTVETAVHMTVSASTNAKANWEVLKNRCKRFESILDEHSIHPALVKAYLAGSSGCWAE
ncbi:MAG TPA: hypothetical protein VNJ87_00065 [Candidatus Macondimonas sp.]|nr:hypothetical protein [Candidatus Macondimonas sp.]